jgi:catechol 2,3-dioxygenase-like lactoylglutathione lyase family enzyme
MTVGAAQVVVNVADLDAVCGSYLARGWEETFRARRLPNHPAKIPFQAIERSALDMSHLALDATPAVEVTRYAGHPPAGATVYELDGAALRGGAVVGVRTCEPRASHAFWRALGFAQRDENVLEARAMLPAWQLQVALRPSGGERPHTSVDAEGCVLVTLLTTAIERELERLAASGLLLRFTAAWEEEVGGRMVTVAFVEGPSGELVELLQVSGGVR